MSLFGFLSRQVLMSRTIRGGVLIHFFMGGLQYQIEHNLLEIKDLPDVARALTVIHRGSLETIDTAWQGPVRQVEALGLTPSGRCREVY
ncbi:MAG: hypothetical protein ACTH2Q_21500, partial [Propionibacteriaceae bacterium]